MPPAAWVSWSSGKDSLWALHETRRRDLAQAVGLLTTVNERVDRVSLHGVPRRVLDAQADALGLPLHVVELPDPCAIDVYEARMSEAVDTARAGCVEAMVFGDLFLDDVRGYRIDKLNGTGVRPLFPLWGRPTGELAAEMVAAGVDAVVSCVDTDQLPAAFAGRRWGSDLLAGLPDGVDPCGENGEFHTCVTAAPDFAFDLDVTVAGAVHDGQFAYADLRLGQVPQGE